MNYLDELRFELTAAGVPARRRRRILAEFTDHLHEDPAAELGPPHDLARQFADELGTRMALRVAVIAFCGLAVTAIAFAAVLVVGTHVVLLPVGVHQVGLVARRQSAWAPLYICAAQFALAAGVLALLRAWRLRKQPVITAAEASILYRRVGIALLAGLLTAGSAPVSGIFAVPGKVYVRPDEVGGFCVLLLLVLSCFTLWSSGLRSTLKGSAGDLGFDLGHRDPRITPLRVAFALGVAIVVVLAAAGIVTGDPYDGAVRGLADAALCLAGFVVLGRYLGLRAPTHTEQ